MKDRATLRQLAAKAGVSPATVSRMLTGHARISGTLRNRITAAARELGFQAETQRNVAIVVPTFSGITGYLALLLSPLCDELCRREFVPMILQLNNLAHLNENIFCGVIATVFDSAINANWNSRYRLPLVSINNSPSQRENIYSVISNEEQGIALALDCFREHGHRKIGMIQLHSARSTDNTTSRARRQQTFEQYFNAGARGIGILREIAFPRELDHGLNELLAEKVTAILICGESLGLPLCRALADRNLRIPEDISVIAHENPGVTPFAFPPLTAIRQDMEMLSVHAANLLERQLRGEKVANVSVDCLLVLRSSVASI